MGYNRITDSGPDAGRDFTVANYNGNFDALALTGVYQLGRGVLSGLALGTATGLVPTVSDGATTGQNYKAWSGLTAPACADNATRYLWIDSDTGAFTYTTTVADPGGNTVCLGQVTTLSGNVTGVTTTGRMSGLRWTDLRTFALGENLINFDLLNQRVGIGMAPIAGHILCVGGHIVATDADLNGNATVAGFVQTATSVDFVQASGDPGAEALTLRLYVKSVSSNPELFVQDHAGNVRQLSANSNLTTRSVNVETLSADKTGAATDAIIQVLTPSGANRKYILPAADMKVVREIHNGATAGSNSIIVRDPTDSTTIATLTNGQMVTVTPRIGGAYGSGGYPGTITPV